MGTELRTHKLGLAFTMHAWFHNLHHPCLPGFINRIYSLLFQDTRSLIRCCIFQLHRRIILRNSVFLILSTEHTDIDIPLGVEPEIL